MNQKSKNFSVVIIGIGLFLVLAGISGVRHFTKKVKLSAQNDTTQNLTEKRTSNEEQSNEYFICKFAEFGFEFRYKKNGNIARAENPCTTFYGPDDIEEKGKIITLTREVAIFNYQSEYYEWLTRENAWRHYYRDDNGAPNEPPSSYKRGSDIKPENITSYYGTEGFMLRNRVGDAGYPLEEVVIYELPDHSPYVLKLVLFFASGENPIRDQILSSMKFFR